MYHTAHYKYTIIRTIQTTIKAAANELTRIKLPRLNTNHQSYQIDV